MKIGEIVIFEIMCPIHSCFRYSILLTTCVDLKHYISEKFNKKKQIILDIYKNFVIFK